MPQPYNYMLNIPSPTENVMNTLNIARGLTQYREEQKSREASQAAADQLKMDISKASENPTPVAIQGLMIKYPQLSENYKRVYDALSEEQKQARINQATQVYAAIEAGKPEMAQKVLSDQIEAYRNAGREGEAKHLETLSNLIEAAPESAKISTGMFLASAMGGDKFTEAFTKLQTERREAELQPEKVKRAQAEAKEAAIKSNFAESNAVLEAQKKGWEIINLREDSGIKKQNQKIAMMKLQLDKEQNELKREELALKVEDAKRKRDEEIRKQTADLESARGNIDNMLNTADRILKTPADVISDATGPIESKLPTLDVEVANFEELIGTIDAQAFLAQIPNMVGKGALSDAEGKKLAAALQNFSLRQSAGRLIENVTEAQRLLIKARKNLSSRYGMPETIPDTPAAEPTPEVLNQLINKYAP